MEIPDTQYPSTEYWNRLEGRTVSEYPLKTLLGAGGSYATYATEHGQDGRPAAIKVIEANRRATQTQLTRWTRISQLSHPNLISILDYGECAIGDVPLLYVVMEWAEDNLAGVLSGRSLSPTESEEMLEPIIAVIGYLHGQGLVHAAIQPSNILADGDRLKLSSDSITPDGEVNAGHESSAYGPPEANPGVASFPGDVWSLGMTLTQALTQQVPGPEAHDAVYKDLPDPFAEIVRHCLKWDPEERWSVAQIASRLHGPHPQVVSKPVQPTAVERKPPIPPKPSTPRKPPKPRTTTRRPKWLIPVFGGALAVVALFALLHIPM
ncbi:MAG: protein kinase, partial [Acidobacteriota bacterium]|nr:protein kinase [Acidobacteriota bacterium]